MDKNVHSAPWEKDERDEALVQELLEIYGWNDMLSVRDWKQRKKQLYNMTRDVLIKINVMMHEKLEQKRKNNCNCKVGNNNLTYLTRNVETHVRDGPFCRRNSKWEVFNHSPPLLCVACMPYIPKIPSALKKVPDPGFWIGEVIVMGLALNLTLDIAVSAGTHKLYTLRI